MKRIFSIVLILVSLKNSLAQQYHPFVEEGKKWDYQQTSFGACAWGGDSYRGDEYYLAGDTVLQGNLFKLLLRRDNYLCTGPCNNDYVVNYNNPSDTIGAIYEGSNKKIWYYDFNSGIDTLLYDFSLNEGDTIKWARYTYVVSGIDSIQLLNGDWRRRIILVSDSVSQVKYWIEGLGSTEFLFQPYSDYAILQSQYATVNRLTCVRDSITDYFENLNPFQTQYCQFQCDIIPGAQIVSTPQILLNQEICISPNPATNEIKISNLPEGESQISIYNLLGQQVKSISVTAQNNSINISDLPSGFYELTIFNNKNFVCKKFVKE